MLSGADDLAAGSGEIAAPIGEIERQAGARQAGAGVGRGPAPRRRPRWRSRPYVPTAARTPAQAARLARELARLMDAMEIEDVDPARMASLVPETYAEHWGTTLAFLKIVTEYWPAHLDGRGPHLQDGARQGPGAGPGARMGEGAAGRARDRRRRHEQRPRGDGDVARGCRPAERRRSCCLRSTRRSTRRAGPGSCRTMPSNRVTPSIPSSA